MAVLTSPTKKTKTGALSLRSLWILIDDLQEKSKNFKDYLAYTPEELPGATQALYTLAAAVKEFHSSMTRLQSQCSKLNKALLSTSPPENPVETLDKIYDTLTTSLSTLKEYVPDETSNKVYYRRTPLQKFWDGAIELLKSIVEAARAALFDDGITVFDEKKSSKMNKDYAETFAKDSKILVDEGESKAKPDEGSSSSLSP